MAKRRAKSPSHRREVVERFLADYRRETVGALLIALGVLATITLTREAAFLARLFGIGAWPLVLALTAGGVITLVWERLKRSVRWEALAALEVAYFTSLALAHQVGSGADPVAAAEAGRGGGIVGFGLSNLATTLLGPLLASGLLVLLLLSAFWAAIQWSPWTPGWAVDWRGSLAAIIEALLPQPSAVTEEPIIVEETSTLPSQQPRAKKRKGAKRRATTAKKERPGEGKAVSPTPIRRSRGLPPLDLLSRDTDTGTDSEEAQVRARIIEDTLHAFGVPANVVDTHIGPTVTQFGVEPGIIERRGPDGEPIQTRVRVSRIVNLANDLALALAAAPIRIEAPVPGRPYVGIEVPNGQTSLVTLRPVLDSEAFRQHGSPLTVALGRGVDGEPISADLATMPHLLIAGATGSGKSVCTNAIITALLMNNPPEQLQLVLVDPKRVDLTNYNGIPHLVGSVVVEMDQVLAALTWVSYQMDERFRLFSEQGVRNIEAYNGQKPADEPSLPYIVVIVDELADLMMTSPEETERRICRLAQMARATGIHLVIATQRPSVDVVTGLIKANFPARVAFAVATQVDSRVILDSPGAERLLGRGDMLFMSPEEGHPRRIQGCYVADREIAAVIDFWQQSAPEATPPQVAPWATLLDEIDDREDDMMADAIALLQGRSRISASMLQRRLRIGYPRAARLIDQLEDRGYVGPDEGGGRSRAVLLNEDDGEFDDFLD